MTEKVEIETVENGFVLRTISEDDSETYVFENGKDSVEGNYTPALESLLNYLTHMVYHEHSGTKWAEKTLFIGVEQGSHWEKPE